MGNVGIQLILKQGQFKITNLKIAQVVRAFIFSLVAALGAVSGQEEPNTLSADEELAGYDLLFNGQDLDNWHAYRQSSVTNAWFAEDGGALGPRIQNGPGNKEAILTDNKYMNFDLKIEVQTTVAGNSGIFVRYQEIALASSNSRSGPEMQICGPSNSDCINPIHSFGAAYEMFPVSEDVRNSWYNPPGQWNQMRIIAFDSNYVHYGNGIKLLEYKIGTPEFIQAYNRSKYVSDGNNGNYYDIHEGGILLQHHGEEGITFRNIKAKSLTVHPFLQEFSDGQWPEELPQDFAMGKRGCTNAEAGNYDAEAIFDDGTCEVTGNVKFASQLKTVKIDKGGPAGELPSVSIPFEHETATLYDIQGNQIPWSNVRGHQYQWIHSKMSRVVILHIGVEGENLTKIFHTI